jgi:Sulfotransferase family
MQHKHLFILTPPFSGSTLLLRLLATSPNVSVFNSDKGEGMMIPELQDTMMTERWNVEKQMPWAYIRTVFEKHWDMHKTVLIEKGSPNMIRADQIEKHFDNAHFIIMMRNPYAWCESMMRRRKPEKPDLKPYNFIEYWLKRADWQIQNIKSLKKVLYFKYEDLCDATDSTIKKIIDFIPEIERLDADIEFEAHSMLGKKRNAITNTNSLALKRLTQQDIKEITNSLQHAVDVIHYFGYELMDAG